MHNRKQRLTFYLIISKYIDEDLFLPKIIEKLKEDLSQKTRNYIKGRVKEIEIDESLNTIKILALFYCLHTQKPKHGYVSMFTKYLIKDTEIDFDPEAIKETNTQIKEIVKRIGLPELEGTTKQFIQNLYYYKPDFLEKYPQLDSRLSS